MASKCALPRSTFPVKFKVKSPVHALELARGLVRPFRHWTVGALAVDAEHIEDDGTLSGRELKPKSAKAEAFCALGALLRVNTKHAKMAEAFLSHAAWQINYDNPPEAEDRPDRQEIFTLNDNARDKETHKRVLKMFTLAIRLAKKASVSGNKK